MTTKFSEAEWGRVSPLLINIRLTNPSFYDKAMAGALMECNPKIGKWRDLEKLSPSKLRWLLSETSVLTGTPNPYSTLHKARSQNTKFWAQAVDFCASFMEGKSQTFIHGWRFGQIKEVKKFGSETVTNIWRNAQLEHVTEIARTGVA